MSIDASVDNTIRHTYHIQKAYKTRLCLSALYMRPRGCRFGPCCTFAHSMTELYANRGTVTCAQLPCYRKLHWGFCGVRKCAMVHDMDAVDILAPVRAVCWWLSRPVDTTGSVISKTRVFTLHPVRIIADVEY